jgi:hydroxymethylbilane synthase
MTVLTSALRLGTRRSALALAQSRLVADALQHHSGRPVDLVEVTTYGDTSAEAIATLGGTGVFVSALREQLLAGEVDLAVHSLKDLPTAPADGLALGAVPLRGDPRDALVGLPLAGLRPGVRVGTGSPRRAAQLRALCRDVEVVAVRGNVDTRIGKVGAGLDAVVLAAAGLARLGRLAAATEILEPDIMLPAPGQGALAVECRADDRVLREALVDLDHLASRAAVAAERSVLAGVEAGCIAPLGALATSSGRALRLDAIVAAPDGDRVLRKTATGPLEDAEDLGRRLADDLLDAGAADLLGESR